MLATVVPSAKRQPFAADNLADFAIVSFSELPVSLVNAFERAVEPAVGGGYLAPSQIKIVEYWQRLNQAYELDEQSAAFRFDDSLWPRDEGKEKAPSWPQKLIPFCTLPKLEAWIVNDGKEGQ